MKTSDMQIVFATKKLDREWSLDVQQLLVYVCGEIGGTGTCKVTPKGTKTPYPQPVHLIAYSVSTVTVAITGEYGQRVFVATFDSEIGFEIGNAIKKLCGQEWRNTDADAKLEQDKKKANDLADRERRERDQERRKRTSESVAPVSLTVTSIEELAKRDPRYAQLMRMPPTPPAATPRPHNMRPAPKGSLFGRKTIEPLPAVVPAPKPVVAVLPDEDETKREPEKPPANRDDHKELLSVIDPRNPDRKALRKVVSEPFQTVVEESEKSNVVPLSISTEEAISETVGMVAELVVEALVPKQEEQAQDLARKSVLTVYQRDLLELLLKAADSELAVDQRNYNLVFQVASDKLKVGFGETIKRLEKKGILKCLGKGVVQLLGRKEELEALASGEK